MTDQAMTPERLVALEREYGRSPENAYDAHDRLLALAEATRELIAEVWRLKHEEEIRYTHRKALCSQLSEAERERDAAREQIGRWKFQLRRALWGYAGKSQAEAKLIVEQLQRTYDEEARSEGYDDPAEEAATSGPDRGSVR